MEEGEGRGKEGQGKEIREEGTRQRVQVLYFRGCGSVFGMKD